MEKGQIPVDYDKPTKYDKHPDSQKRRELKYNKHGEYKRVLSFAGYSVLKNGIYGPKPRLNLITEVDTRPKAQYLIGIEIEVENYSSGRNDRLSKLLTDYLPDSHYVCTDGSLDNGVEIVTAPRTFAEIRLMYSRYYKLLNGLSRIGMTAHDNGKCGLHFHISRKLYSEEVWLAMSKFIVKHQSLFKRLSRRGNCLNYCKFIVSRDDRYVALNLTNPNTVEFRFFRGSLKPESFFAALEIIISILELFKSGKRHGLRKWAVIMQRPTYKYAYKYALERGLAPYVEAAKPRRKITDEDRRLRLERIAKNKKKAFDESIAYLRGLITQSGVSEAQVYMPYNKYQIDLSNKAVKQSLIPIAWTGISQAEHKALTQASICVPILHIEGAKPRSITVSKKDSWGNTRAWHTINWPDNAVYFGETRNKTEAAKRYLKSLYPHQTDAWLDMYITTYGTSI